MGYSDPISRPSLSSFSHLCPEFASDLEQTRLFRRRLGAGVRRLPHRSRGNRHIRGADQPELIGSGRLHSFLRAGTEVLLRISRTGFPCDCRPLRPCPAPHTERQPPARPPEVDGRVADPKQFGDSHEVVRTCAPRPCGAESRDQLETA